MTLQLQATPEEVMRAVEALQTFGRQQGITDKNLFGPLLALEECGSNIVDYALRRDSRRMFQVTMSYIEEALTIELQDDGPEFDPTTYRNPEWPEEAPAGGWGLKLVRRSMDEVRYMREKGTNILTLRKVISVDKQITTTTSSN